MSLSIDYDRLHRQVDAHPYPLVFATISGAHLYGFPSPDSDFDLRGVHLLPLEQVVGMTSGEETVEKSGVYDGMEVDLVTHDAKKFFGLMLKKNGYVLEQLLSPLVVYATPEHEELKELAKQCVTRYHGHHYLGFAATQWKLFRKEEPPRVKPLLYVYRVLLTGIHLVKSGEVEANLLTLNESAKLPYIDELVERKRSGPEKGELDAADVTFHEKEYLRLVAALEAAGEASKLPEQPNCAEQLNNLLVRLRLAGRPTRQRESTMEAVIFTGIQASGKSTFYKERYFDSHVRISLGLLRTRHRETLLLNACLTSQQPFVVDNTNPTREERSRYIELSLTHGFRVLGYYFRSEVEGCKERNAARSERQIVPLPGLLGTYKRLELP